MSSKAHRGGFNAAQDDEAAEAQAIYPSCKVLRELALAAGDDQRALLHNGHLLGVKSKHHQTEVYSSCGAAGKTIGVNSGGERRSG